MRQSANIFLTVSAILFSICVSPGAAEAQSGLGVRAGISAQPEQFYAGVHTTVSEVANRIWFRPNAEAGIGNRATVATFNGEFAYFPQASGKWKPYFGGGPALVVSTVRAGVAGRRTDAGPGFNFLLGVEQRKGLMAEIKAGVLDSPGFKLGVGWNW